MSKKIVGKLAFFEEVGSEEVIPSVTTLIPAEDIIDIKFVSNTIKKKQYYIAEIMVKSQISDSNTFQKCTFKANIIDSVISLLKDPTFELSYSHIRINWIWNRDTSSSAYIPHLIGFVENAH